MLLSVLKANGRRLVLGIIVLLCGTRAQGQLDSSSGLTRAFTAYSRHTAHEKLFLHLDKPFYVCGEVLWFKAYVLDGTTHRPLPSSMVAYVEVLDARNRPVLQTKVALRGAVGQGALELPNTLPSGQYVVRAYTRWMQNFDPDFYFQQSVSIVNTFASAGLSTPAAPPVPTVRFFPESGNLVRNCPNKLAFQVLDGAGRGLAARGVVVDGRGAAVAQFSTRHAGLGHIDFLPAEAGATYKAILSLPNGRRLTQALPTVQEYGYSLHMTEVSGTEVRLQVRSNFPGAETEKMFLLVHARQQLATATAVQLQGGQAGVVLSRQALHDGISHLTLFNERQQPVCERLLFERPRQLLTLSPGLAQTTYGLREQVSLPVTPRLADRPFPASVSAAVYRLDSLSAATPASINAFVWLTSDLRGTVETPDYYLSGPLPEAAEAADELMLTHGWSRFRWADVLGGSKPAYSYLPELSGHIVQAHVASARTGAPVAGVPVTLSVPGQYARLYSATSQPDGTVQIETHRMLGSPDVVVQAQGDSAYKLTLLSPFSTRYTPFAGAPPLALNRFRQELTAYHLGMQVQKAWFAANLRPVAPAKPDTTAFYGQPDARYYLDDYTRFSALEEVMREYVPWVVVRIRKGHFRFMVVDKPNSGVFEDNPLVLVDGVPVTDIDRLLAFDPLKIKRLDVVTSRYFNGSSMYNGIVSYSTYQGDLANFKLDPQAMLQSYEGLQAEREFYAPQYATASARQSPTPDLRNLLYWNPSVTDAGQQVVFYTGDQPGHYVVVLQGIGTTGVTGYTALPFSVKSAL